MVHDARRELGWLHFTDLHVGQPKEVARQAQVETELLRDLASESRGRNIIFDIIFFSGDIAFKGDVAEYLRATALLGRIIDEVTTLNEQVAKGRGLLRGTVVPVLIPVPGNHDLKRPDKPDADAVRRAFAERQAYAAPLWSDLPTFVRDTLEKAFADYERWLQHPLPFPPDFHTRGAVPGDRLTRVVRGGVSVGVVALNTAWLHFDDEATGSLHLDLSQLTALTPRPKAWADESDFVVLMTHHPPSWLSPVGQRNLSQEVWPAADVDLHLFGHDHGGSRRTQPGTLAVRHLVEGRSLFGAEEGGRERLHGYTLGRFVIDQTANRARTGDPPNGSVDGPGRARRDDERTERLSRRRVELWDRPAILHPDRLSFGPTGPHVPGDWKLVIDLGLSKDVGPADDTTVSHTRRLGDLSPSARLSWKTTDYAKALAAPGRWLFLSASVPYEHRDPHRRSRDAPFVRNARAPAIRSFVSELCKQMAPLDDWGIVFGGHPSITALIAQSDLVWAIEPRLMLFQDARFWCTFQEEVGILAAVKGVLPVLIPEDTRAPCETMREEMLALPNLRGAIFVGGMKGVQDEFDLFAARQPTLPTFAVGLGGGAAAELHFRTSPPSDPTGGVPPAALWHTPEVAVTAILQKLGAKQ